MAVGKKFFSGENVLQLAALLSVTRPDLQQYLQSPIQPLQEVPGGYNWTGPYSTYGSTLPFDYTNTNPKDNAATFEQNTNYLNDILDWHNYRGRHEEFINMRGGIASQNEGYVDTESGYSSDHSALSPSPSSATSASPRRDEFQTDSHGSQIDLSQLGATGYTPAAEDPDLYKLILDSFGDGFGLSNNPESDLTFTPTLPIKSEPLSPLSQQDYSTSCPVTKGGDLSSKAGCLEDESFYHDPNHKSTLEQIGLQNNFQEELFDPFSIDWSSPATNASSTSFNPDLSLVNDFDLDPLSSTWADDFNLPLDILKSEEQSQPVPENDSGRLLSGKLIFVNATKLLYYIPFI